MCHSALTILGNDLAFFPQVSMLVQFGFYVWLQPGPTQDYQLRLNAVQNHLDSLIVLTLSNTLKMVTTVISSQLMESIYSASC